MKKKIVILLSMMMLLGLTACGNSGNQTDSSASEENDVENANAPEGQQAGAETSGETKISDAQGGNVLVAYFSATNTTEGVAEHIADGLNADIYEIVPEEPYTDADLNYNDNNSRTTIEMNDPASRPAISGSVENMEEYSIVFLGYLIWLAYHNLIQCTQA